MHLFGCVYLRNVKIHHLCQQHHKHPQTSYAIWGLAIAEHRIVSTEPVLCCQTKRGQQGVRHSYFWTKSQLWRADQQGAISDVVQTYAVCFCFGRAHCAHRRHPTRFEIDTSQFWNRYLSCHSKVWYGCFCLLRFGGKKQQMYESLVWWVSFDFLHLISLK